jgi:DNA-binding transcriptional MocR family regulator
MVTNPAPGLEVLGARLEERTSRGLARAVSSAIGDGTLVEGSKLPPIRAVARSLGLSPSTVSTAWDLLARAGTIRSEGRRGTTVSARGGPGPARYRRALGRTVGFDIDLSTGVPDAALLPDLAPALATTHRAWDSNSYLDQPVLPELDAVLRAEWPYDPGAMTVVDGAMDALDQVASSLLRFGDTVVVEDPSFPPLLDLLDALGVRTVGVAVDDEGLDPVGLAAALERRPKAVFLQPRGQNPTGASLSQARAAELAGLLRGHPVVVMEDDSAGAIACSDPISLGRWIPDQTVHVRSFSKSHGPDLRLAAVSGPPAIMDGVIERRLLGQGWTSRLLQHVLLALLTSATSQAQVARARETYATRRAAATAALGDLGVTVGGNDGLNIWLPVGDESAAMLFLASHGIGVAAGEPFTTSSGTGPHLRVTVGLLGHGTEAVAGHLAEASGLGPARPRR